jgi:diguanylate cyclase (GGDEF)-like protein
MSLSALEVEGVAAAARRHPNGFASCVDALLSAHPRRRTRLTLWLVAALVYVASGAVLWFGLRQGWMDAGQFVPWCAFLACALVLVYVALRSGWSERFTDPGLTALQIVIGVIGVDWGYFICGPVRSMTLFPLLLIFTFGAFSLDWRRIAALTAFALASLLGTIVALHATRAGAGASGLDDADLHLDLANVLMISIMLPALAFVAAMLSGLRAKLRAQRTALTGAMLELQRIATHDALTGLGNRRYMDQRLAEEQAISERLERPFSIALVDLDHFKQINDLRGHAGGDRVLQWFADQARTALRSCDQIARWGGEEFLVLMPGTAGAPALACVQRLLQQLHAVQAGDAMELSFSAGVTEYRNGETLAETIARADREMYAAKDAGRSNVRLG